MRIIAVTQARVGSTRLPGKVMMKVGEDTLLGIHLERILKAKMLTSVTVATTVAPEDEPIVEVAKTYGVGTFRGSVEDVLDRFCQALRGQRADYVARLTSDCPLIDPVLIDKVIKHATDNDLDYCSNTLDPSYPDGQDVEVFKMSALEAAWQKAQQKSEREHVTPYIWKNSTFKGGNLFKSDNFKESYDYGHLRMTVDEAADFDLIRRLINEMGKNRSWLEYAEHLKRNELLRSLNADIGRNEGYEKSLNTDNEKSI